MSEAESEQARAWREEAQRENIRRFAVDEKPVCPTCASLGLGFVEMAVDDDAPHAGGVTMYGCATHGDMDFVLG